MIKPRELRAFDFADFVSPEDGFEFVGEVPGPAVTFACFEDADVMSNELFKSGPVKNAAAINVEQ